MNVKMILLTVALAGLAGCGGESASTGGGGPSQEVRSLDVNGTSADAGGITPINPAENLGRFSIKWKVRDSFFSYRAAMAVSLDKVASGSDRVFFFRSCGSSNDTCPRANTTTVDCQITNENILSCTGDDDQADLTTFFDVLPKDAYIIIETCLISNTGCFTKAHPVQFQ